MIPQYGLRIVSAASMVPVTVAEAKQHCQIFIEDDNNLLAGYLAAATRYAETVTRLQLLSTTLCMTMDRFPCAGRDNRFAQIELPRQPLLEVTSISYVDLAGDTQTLAESAYAVHADLNPPEICPAYNTSWPATRCQRAAVTVEFVAGLGATAAAVPETIKTAIKQLVAHWYEHREAVSETRLGSVPMCVETLLHSERAY